MKWLISMIIMAVIYWLFKDVSILYLAIFVIGMQLLTKWIYNTPLTYDMTLNHPWFDFTERGDKIFEGRCRTNKINGIRKGDFIIFAHYTDPYRLTFKKKVKGVQYYRTFREALEFHHRMGQLQKVLPGVITVDEGVQIYHTYVSQPTQERDGVCLIELQNV